MNLLPANTAQQLGIYSVDNIYCCKAETMLDCLPEACIDLIVTSPPYDNLRTYKGFSWDFQHIARQSYRVLKPGGVLVWVVGDSTLDGDESTTSFEQALYFKKQAGFKLWDTMIWRKFLPGDYGKRYCQAFEYMFVLAKETVNTWNPQLRRNKSAGHKAQGSQRNGYITQNGYVKTDREWIVKDYGVMENVWDIPPAQSDVKHPAQFPEALAERHILTRSNPGDIVLDYFTGSGTIAKMARANNRRYLGCDISAEYVALAQKRLAQPYTPNMFETLAVSE